MPKQTLLHFSITLVVTTILASGLAACSFLGGPASEQVTERDRLSPPEGESPDQAETRDPQEEPPDGGRRQEPETEATLFDFDEIEPGDRVAGLTVRSVGPVDSSAEAAGPLDPTAVTNASVEFSGEVVVTGEYVAWTEEEHRERSDVAGYYNPRHRVCLRNLDERSLARLPRMRGDRRTPSFCFSNPEEAAEALGEGTAGKATVLIDEYDINLFPSEVANMAHLVEVRSITTLPMEKDIRLPTEAGEVEVPHRLIHNRGPFWTYVDERAEVEPLSDEEGRLAGLRIGDDPDYVIIRYLPEGTTEEEAEQRLRDQVAEHFTDPQYTDEDVGWAVTAFRLQDEAPGVLGYARLIEYRGWYFTVVARLPRNSETSAAARQVLYEEWRWKDTGEMLVIKH